MSESSFAEILTDEQELKDTGEFRSQHDEIVIATEDALVGEERKRPRSHPRSAIDHGARGVSMSKQLSSHRTKPQAKVTIVGAGRSTFACALTMGLRRHVSEIIIYDQSHNTQMKTSFDDVSEPLEVNRRHTFSCYGV